ncbi:Protein of unknown function [Bacillus wiedmannii]|uniref:Uncharacterized protein n=1 Tax=Bacillus wiedmannii TaxID=1890302 RepID=A0A1C4FK89_9BACI|nr:Protein of unknown function [Bacillus wiedmannii]
MLENVQLKTKKGLSK